MDLEGPFDKSHPKRPEYPAGKINKLIAIKVAVTPSVIYSGRGKIEAQPGMKPLRDMLTVVTDKSLKWGLLVE